jgi:GNAT superfamily N-acetyltransferase
MTITALAPTVDDAVRSHVSWMTALAGLAGGATWTDGSLRWAYDGPYGTLHALFPDEVSVDAARRGLERARSMNAAHVAVWSASDVERPELEEIGFEVGWQPWWMGRATAGVDEESLRLARCAVLSVRARPREQARQPLLDRDDVFRIDARADGRYAGRAWGHLQDTAAGIYDMMIRAPFRRRGLGTEVVTAILAQAGSCGADRVTLNATPEGEKLYSACGFTLLGRGRTWWWHAPRDSAPQTSTMTTAAL